MVLVGANKIHYKSNIIIGGRNRCCHKISYSWGRNSSCYKSSYRCGKKQAAAIRAVIFGEGMDHHTIYELIEPTPIYPATI